MDYQKEDGFTRLIYVTAYGKDRGSISVGLVIGWPFYTQRKNCQCWNIGHMVTCP
jgi:hypothetical protein